ncbi:hypothetical protein FA15DRAFT_675089 [Coprinopsis marcescibilis]|uniref:Homeobox domain-containing protein n=1 Tax=Coprinopsis marcescibilis TaxID=230819 RepID=A0A5C3KF57_COPMA|nr:hypothetical protein FA15DRAFT_675089 [Coprinopsis marcescibilis]
MQNLPPSLSRTSSSTSFSSCDDIAATSANASRRTRKRFTNTQLTMLENLFHQTSHPSREERESVAKAGQMEIKSVTIWFQNKRQTERKTAASKESSGRTVSPTSTVSSSKSVSSLGARPSLDRIATRTEMRNHHSPRTPRRQAAASNHGSGAIWDHMPSSPLVPPSPASSGSEYLDFTKNSRSKRTLEWACAAARVQDKDQCLPKYSVYSNSSFSSVHPPPSISASSSATIRSRTVHRQKPEASFHPDVTPKGAPMDLDSTDDEAEEAITPPSTWGREDYRWEPHPGAGVKKQLAHHSSFSQRPAIVDDEDDAMMKAALALCGLGGRR